MEERKDPLLDPSSPASVESTPPDLSRLAGALGGLLRDPDLSARLGRIVSSAIEHSETPSSPNNAPPPTPEQTAVATSATDGLSSLLSNPALLERLPQILSTVGPLLSGMGDLRVSASPKKEPEALPVCRDNLLLALKPFLSPERRRAVDSILSISKLGAILAPHTDPK